MNDKITVDAVAYPVCVISVIAFALTTLTAIWIEFENELLWKLAGSFGILSFCSALALSAARAFKGPS